jgi:hypothetical protein
MGRRQKYDGRDSLDYGLVGRVILPLHIRLEQYIIVSAKIAICSSFALKAYLFDNKATHGMRHKYDRPLGS